MKEGLIKVAVVDDHTLFRNGVASLLGEFEEIRVVFEAGEWTGDATDAITFYFPRCHPNGHQYPRYRRL